MPLCGRLFSEAKPLFLFGLRAELRISSCCRGLTSLTTLAVSRAWRGVGVGSGVKGAVLWRSSGPLTPLPRPISLEPGTKRHVLYRASFLDGEVLRFGPELHGVVF